MISNCKNCGTALQGNYCHICGQKLMRPGDKKLRHLVIEFFHHFTHLDSKFLKTLRNIFLRPGLVTKEVGDGITVPHFKLSALFLIGTIIYFLLPADFTVSSMNTDFKKQTADTTSDFYQWKQELVEKKLARTHTSLETLATKYDTRQHEYGKLLTLILIPLLIPLLWIINLLIKLFKRQHPITAYDLGVASLEINSIFLLGMGLFAGLLVRALALIIKNETFIQTVFIILITALAYLLLRFFMNAYQIKWWLALGCLLLLGLGYSIILSIYSFISFLIFI